MLTSLECFLMHLESTGAPYQILGKTCSTAATEEFRRPTKQVRFRLKPDFTCIGNIYWDSDDVQYHYGGHLTELNDSCYAAENICWDSDDSQYHSGGTLTDLDDSCCVAESRASLRARHTA